MCSIMLRVLLAIIGYHPSVGFFIILFIYSSETETQREKQAPCREPNVGLNPRTLGSCPEPKADAQPRSYPGVPGSHNLKKIVSIRI